MVIQTRDGREFYINDVQDLLRFSENDIRLMARKDIMCDEMSEELTKRFRNALNLIVENKLWAGSGITSVKFTM